MAKGFDVLHLKSAVPTHSDIDLSFDHLTTFNFGQIVPLAKIKTVPGDKFNINGNYFSRLAPLVKPTYGKFSFRVVNGYVPIHMLAYDGEAWINGNVVFEGSTPVGRFITIGDIDEFARNYCLTTTGATASNSNYTIVNSSGTTEYYIFTDVGRYYIKVLNALGYSLPQGVDLRTSSYWYTKIRVKNLSAFPLLAFAKLYNDYMSQSQLFNISTLTNFLRCVKYRTPTTGFNENTGVISYYGMLVLLEKILLNYDNDYFTSAWQDPNEAISYIQHISSVNVPSNSVYPTTIGLDTNDTYLVDSNNIKTLGQIPQRALQMLDMFEKWVKRMNYSGSRSVQQLFSRMGIKSEDYRSHYAHILSTESMPVQVGDVTATAQTSGIDLGDYAGKGIMNGSKGFSCECSDYGYILSLGYFTVIPMNPYGFDKDVLTVSPLDFYTPEFDGVGADAISYMEYYENPTQDPNSDSSKSDSVFGFTERYNSYRFGRDLITGDFRDYRNNGDMNTWHTGRNMTTIRSAGNLVAQSSAVNTLPQIASEYNRLFSVTSDSIDHFYLTSHFQVKSVRPMKNLNQVIGLGVGDIVVPRNGNTIS